MSSEQLQAAQAALQRGERIHARKLARQALLQNPRDEQAWLLMARVVDQPEQVIDCLEQALKINPGNQATARALRALRRQAEREPAVSFQPPPEAATPVESEPRREQKVEMLPVAPVRSQAAAAEPRKQVNIRSSHHRVNWSLIFGSFLVAVVLLIGVVGQHVAPADPLEEHVIVRVGDDWVPAPFPAFTVPGFLLGSDQFGRDLLSRILWGVRPTLSMVATVAVVRLFLGTLIGLGAGWFNGRFGRTLDMLISAALAVPVFFIALGAIAMLGADIGLLAFIVGLSINGWGETARIVRDQTQTIKQQQFIEAAHALGSSTLGILRRHILRQLMPMVWMLFAFEISSTLMVTAGLGFLGYYIGGDVWVEVSDFVSRRISGMPELGQMLSTSWVNLVEPWPLVMTGSVVFLAVLGFNLMGEGLRTRLNPEFINRNSLTARFGRRLGSWAEERVTYPLGVWLRRSLLHPVMLVIGVLGMAAILYGMQNLLKGAISLNALTVPGGQTWSTERGDPYGSRSTALSGPTNPEVLWTFNFGQDIAGGPVVSADGMLYVAVTDGRLVALTPDGDELWTVSLPVELLSAPALSSDGTVYVLGKGGWLFAVSPDSLVLWEYQVEADQNGIARVVQSPVVSSEGVIYFLVEDSRGDILYALSPDSTLLWSMPTGTRRAETSPRLSPDEELIFVKNVILDAEDGSVVEVTLPSSNDPTLGGREQLVVGGDGLLYLHVGHYVMQWQLSRAGFEVVQTAEWNYRGAGLNQNSSFPVDAGVTRNGNIWLFYNSFYGGTRLIWLDPTGVVLGTSPSGLFNNSQVVAVDNTNTAYLCGQSQTSQTRLDFRCQAFPQGNAEPSWELVVAEIGQDPLGTALAPGRLYVTTTIGNLYALGDVQTPVP